MVLMMLTVRYPISQSSKVAKRYLESAKKYPPDASLSKTLAIGARSTKDGMIVFGLGDVVKGRYEDALLRLARSEQEFFADIDGFSYEVDTFMDITEAMPIVGMEAPENR